MKRFAAYRGVGALSGRLKWGQQPPHGFGIDDRVLAKALRHSIGLALTHHLRK